MQANMNLNNTNPSTPERNASAIPVVYAFIVGLEGEPLNPGTEPPELCRTLSGRVYYRFGKKPDEVPKLRRSDFGLSKDFKVQKFDNRPVPALSVPTDSDCESSDEEADSQSELTSKHPVLEKEARRMKYALTASVSTSKPSSLRSSTGVAQAHLRLASVASDAAKALSSRSTTTLLSRPSFQKSLPRTSSLSLKASSEWSVSVGAMPPRTPSPHSLDDQVGTEKSPVVGLGSPFRTPPRSIAHLVNDASSRQSGHSNGVYGDLNDDDYKSIIETPGRLYQPPEGWDEREMAMTSTAPRVFAGKGHRRRARDT